MTRQTSTELTEYCLRALNRFLDVYVTATEQSDVREMTFEHVGPETTLGLRYTSRGSNRSLKMPNLTSVLPGELPPAREGLLPMLPRLLMSEAHGHPIDLVRRLKVRANRFADQGDFETAIITLQSSAERLVFALHELVAVDADLTRAAITEAQPHTFKSALTGLTSSLGGNWSLKGSTPVAIYWKDLYLVRNTILHAGASADRDTTADAFGAYDMFWRHCLDRCVAVRSHYPRTALAILGGIGLREAGALDRRMRDFITQVEARGDAHRFWLPPDERSSEED